MSDLTDMLADPDFRTGDYTVTRTAAPSWLAGVKVAGATSTLTTGDASLQALDGADRKVLAEGVHVTNMRKLYTTFAFQLEPADTIAVASPPIDAGTWLAVGVEHHTGMGGTHYVVYLAKQGIPT